MALLEQQGAMLAAALEAAEATAAEEGLRGQRASARRLAGEPRQGAAEPERQPLMVHLKASG